MSNLWGSEGIAKKDVRGKREEEQLDLAFLTSNLIHRTMKLKTVEIRSRTEPLRDDRGEWIPALAHKCRLSNDSPSRHPDNVQARISFFETVASSKMQVD